MSLASCSAQVCDEPPRVSTHSTFGLFVDDTSFLTEVPLVGTPPLSEGVSTPGGVSTPTATIPTDQLRLHSTPNANSQTVSGEPRSATPSRSGGRVSQKSNRKAPKVPTCLGQPCLCLLSTCSCVVGVVLTASSPSVVCTGQGEAEEGATTGGGPTGWHLLCEHQLCCH